MPKSYRVTKWDKPSEAMFALASSYITGRVIIPIDDLFDNHDQAITYHIQRLEQDLRALWAKYGDRLEVATPENG